MITASALAAEIAAAPPQPCYFDSPAWAAMLNAVAALKGNGIDAGAFPTVVVHPIADAADHGVGRLHRLCRAARAIGHWTAGFFAAALAALTRALERARISTADLNGDLAFPPVSPHRSDELGPPPLQDRLAALTDPATGPPARRDLAHV